MKRCNTREMGNKRHMTLLQISRRLCYSFIFREEGGKFVSISLSLSLRRRVALIMVEKLCTESWRTVH